MIQLQMHTKPTPKKHSSQLILNKNIKTSEEVRSKRKEDGRS